VTRVVLFIDRLPFPHDIIEVRLLSTQICQFSSQCRYSCLTHTRISKAYGHAARTPSNHTPRALNSLTAIAGQEGEEEEWESDLRGLRNEDEVIHFHSILSLSPGSSHCRPWVLTLCPGGLRCREFAIPILGSTRPKLAISLGYAIQPHSLPTPRLCRSKAPIAHCCDGRGQENSLGRPQACWDPAKPRPHTWTSTPTTQPHWRRGRFRKFQWPRGRILLRTAGFDSGPAVSQSHQPDQSISMEHP
jgi:hypothetical protein